MDIHKPKPWHGLRAFLKEYAIIVLGVLTAITLEQTVEQLHWRHEVKMTHAALAEEMADDNAAFAFRIAARPCIERRLDFLEDVIERASKHQTVPILGRVITRIGWALNDNEWEIGRASQTLNHFDDKELSVLSGYYLQIGTARHFILGEMEIWGVLKVLKGDPARLGSVDIAGLRVAVQNARADNQLIAAIAEEELASARQLHMHVPAADVVLVRNICEPIPEEAAE